VKYSKPSALITNNQEPLETYMNQDTKKQDTSTRGTDANRDPLTGKPGAHPVGTGVGAAGGGAAGAAIGAVAGPVGAAVGLVAGAIAGGLAGKGVAETIDPTVEDAYWKANYSTRSYVDKGSPYETYQPAYRTGYEGYSRYPGKQYDEVEPDLQRDYERARGTSNLSWEKAKKATRDAWHRVEKAMPGDADRDGR
jgi:outer membrane lipoprotein SlyB